MRFLYNLDTCKICLTNHQNYIRVFCSCVPAKYMRIMDLISEAAYHSPQSADPTHELSYSLILSVLLGIDYQKEIYMWERVFDSLIYLEPLEIEILE